MHRQSKYVYIYNQILKMIRTSRLAVGSKLPSEKVLSEQFDVSRVTLRTALSLLKDDGIIKSIHGQGNFILPGDYNEKSGLEQFKTPIYKSLIVPIQPKEAYAFKNEPSEYTDQLFGQKNEDYYSMNIWYQHNSENVANTFVITSPDVIKEYNLNLKSDAEIIQFIENKIYYQTNSSRVVITISDRKINSFKRKFKNDEPLVLITEDLFKLNGSCMAQCKYYIPISLFRTTFNRYTSDIDIRETHNDD